LDRDKYLGVDDLKKMMKKINSSPLEPSGIEEMIREVDEDGDGKLSLREVSINSVTTTDVNSESMSMSMSILNSYSAIS